MSKIILIIAVLGLAAIGGVVTTRRNSAASRQPVIAISDSSSYPYLRQAKLDIAGMWCTGCAVGAEYSLKSIAGVVDAGVTYAEGASSQAWVVYQAGQVSQAQIVAAVSPYQATIVSDTDYTQPL